jgi:hypothetical protein
MPKLQKLVAPFALVAPLMMWTQPAGALITQQERDACSSSYGVCQAGCSARARECGPVGSKDYNSCSSDCNGKCSMRKENCLDAADKDRRNPAVQHQPGIQKVPASPDLKTRRVH